MGLGLAFKTFFRVLGNGEFAAKVRELDQPAAVVDPEEEERRLLAERTQLLALLQRDGRLLDFLSENLKDYSDAQIGAAVRDIHRDCQAVLQKYLTLGPVLDGKEDTDVEVPAGFDPARIRLTGNVKGSAPLKGILAHRGWEVKSVQLPTVTVSPQVAVLSPAEVEVL